MGDGASISQIQSLGDGTYIFTCNEVQIYYHPVSIRPLQECAVKQMILRIEWKYWSENLFVKDIKK